MKSVWEQEVTAAVSILFSFSLKIRKKRRRRRRRRRQRRKKQTIFFLWFCWPCDTRVHINDLQFLSVFRGKVRTREKWDKGDKKISSATAGITYYHCPDEHNNHKITSTEDIIRVRSNHLMACVRLIELAALIDFIISITKYNARQNRNYFRAEFDDLFLVQNLFYFRPLSIWRHQRWSAM